jgi:large subunit ribosomal protein L15
MPLIQRLPKMRGFKSLNTKPQTVKVSELEKHFKPGEIVTPQALAKKGLVQNAKLPVKILTDKTTAISFTFQGVKLNQKLLKAYLANKKVAKKPVTAKKK